MKCPKCKSTDAQFEFHENRTVTRGADAGCGDHLGVGCGTLMLAGIVGYFSQIAGAIVLAAMVLGYLWYLAAGGSEKYIVKHYRCKSCGKTWTETE